MKLVYYDRVDVSEGTDVKYINNTSKYWQVHQRVYYLSLLVFFR